MRVASSVFAVGLAAAFATSSLANSVDGTWNVTLTGAVASTCVAELHKSGDHVTGEVVCREAGFRFPLSARIQGSQVVNAATGGDSAWTATIGANSGSGTYMSPMGPGSWSARRQD